MRATLTGLAFAGALSLVCYQSANAVPAEAGAKRVPAFGCSGDHDDEVSSQFVGPTIDDGTDWNSALDTSTAKRVGASRTLARLFRYTLSTSSCWI
jgi:hypothetical protein